MSGYTKGPWKEDEMEYCGRLSHGVVNGDEDVVIAHCDSDNLSLIAAAPELLEELENANALIAILRAFLGPDNDYYTLINEHMAKSAPLVAKAKGE